MTKRSVSRGSFEGCGFCSVPSLIDERYKRGVLCALANFGIVRFNEMKRYIGKVSYKTPQFDVEGAGGRWARAAQGVPSDTAQGGIQPHGTGPDADSRPGSDVRLGP